LDIRADGGYAVFTGRTPRGEYTWLRDAEPDDLSVLPTELREFLGLLHPPAAAPEEEPKPNGNHHAVHGDGRVDAERLISMALDRVASEGRNNAGFWLAAQLRDNGYTQYEAESVMRNYAGRCPRTNVKGEQETYTPGEIHATVREIYSRPAREPWGQRHKPAPEKESQPATIDQSDSQKKTRHFVQSPEGVFYVDEETDARTFVCSPLRVEAYTRDSESESWGRLLTWADRNGREHSWAMPMQMLAGDGTTLREALLNGGVLIGTGTKARQLLLQYIQSENPGRSAICVHQLGWHNQTYVLPNCCIPNGAEKVIYQTASRGEHFYHTAGTLDEWKERISSKCVENSRLVFAISAAFSGPLLSPLNVEGGGYHLTGTTSTGKTTAQWVAGSVIGGRGTHGFARSWRFTQNALESTCELHNDGLLILDELREVPDPKDLDSIIYMISNGCGKGRMTRAMIAQRTPTWRLQFLSSGEIRLSEYAAAVGTRIKGGADVRLINISSDVGAGLGIFENIHGAESAKAFAEELKTASTQAYGTPLRAFLTELVGNLNQYLVQATAFIREFTAQTLNANASPEVGRAHRRIALVAASGEIATTMGITGWPPGEARRAAERCYNDWITDRGGVGQADVEAGIRQVRAFIASKGASRFQSVVQEIDGRGNELRERINERAGFWKEENGERLYLIFTSIFTDEVCRGFNSKLILEELEKRELLVKGDGRNFARKETVPHEGQIRVYVIRARILAGRDE
jgi:putative DNA primase/helicase